MPNKLPPGPCGMCVPETGPLPPVTALQVADYFRVSMLQWLKAGAPVVTEEAHAQRMAVCEACPHYTGFWCSKCRCIAKAKSKLATEQCPDSPPRWFKTV